MRLRYNSFGFSRQDGRAEGLGGRKTIVRVVVKKEVVKKVKTCQNKATKKCQLSVGRP